MISLVINLRHNISSSGQISAIDIMHHGSGQYLFGWSMQIFNFSHYALSHWMIDRKQKFLSAIKLFISSIFLLVAINNIGHSFSPPSRRHSCLAHRSIRYFLKDSIQNVVLIANWIYTKYHSYCRLNDMTRYSRSYTTHRGQEIGVMGSYFR